MYILLLGTIVGFCGFRCKFTLEGTLDLTTLRVEMINTSQYDINIKVLHPFNKGNIIKASSLQRSKILNKDVLTLLPSEEIQLYGLIELEGRELFNMKSIISLVEPPSELQYLTEFTVGSCLITDGDDDCKYTSDEYPHMVLYTEPCGLIRVYNDYDEYKIFLVCEA